MLQNKVLEKRRKNGTFAKKNIPQNPFKKGNIPWNKGKGNPKTKFKCLNCKKQVIVSYGRRHYKFCSVKCSGHFNATHNPILLKNRWKPKPLSECIYLGKEKEYKRKWYLKNKEKIIRMNKERYQQNKEKYKIVNNKWRKANKEKVSFIKQQYKRRKRNAKGSFSFEEWVALKKKCNYKCNLCGKKEPIIKLEADHIIPLSKEGSNYIDNIQPLCRSCNASKGNRIKMKI